MNHALTPWGISEEIARVAPGDAARLWLRLRRRHLMMMAAAGAVLLFVDRTTGAVVLGAVFLVDFLRERAAARMRYRDQLMRFRDRLAAGRSVQDFYTVPENTQRLDDRRASAGGFRYPDSLITAFHPDAALAGHDPTQFLNNLCVSEIVVRHDIRRVRVCDLGCADGRSTVLLVGGEAASRMPADGRYRAAEVANAVIGVDLVAHYLAATKSALRIPVALANIKSVPLQNAQFDVACVSQILQAVDEPLQALEEARRIVKPGGLLVLTVPNRAGVYLSEWINPLLVLAKAASALGIDRWLPPRQVLLEDRGSDAYYNSFSRREVVSLIERAGFRPIRIGTFSFFRGLHAVVSRVRPLSQLGPYAAGMHAAEKFFRRVPLLGQLGTHWAVVACRD